MLKRIKVRGKLLLLLATPLVAVVAFAYTGIVDRTERTEFQEGEAQIAELADAGADLSLAIQVERIRVLEYERMLLTGDDGLDAERAETNAQLTRWIGAVDAARDQLRDPQLIAGLDELVERLPTTLSDDRGVDAVTGTLLAGASRAVAETTSGLAGEAQDLDLFRALTDLNELLEIQAGYATITSVGSEAIFQGELTAVAATLVSDAERSVQNSTLAFVDSADRQYVTSFSRLENSGVLPNPSSGATDIVAELQDYITDPATGGVVAWLERGEAQLRGLNDIIGQLATDANLGAQQEAATARDEARSYLILAGSVILLALIMAIMIGRSISRPLTRLTRSAEQLSAEELPALVESMRSAGRAEAPVLTPIEAKGRDEVAQLAHAISEIQQVTIDVAEEQADLLRRGISDIFVNLARRNQSLLDRQIDFIDQLESREENPDQLENLFRLDHLATRMRRNAESLLVLAGAEPTRRRGAPVELADVLRVAMGEIEDFSRIRLMSVDSSTVAGSVAVDLAHLMSELMENATQFSPPDVDVEVVGYRIADDSYQLTLTDKGIGMSAEQIATANKTLAEPPLVGLDLSRSLGFTVVSRLAHRLGVTVQLAAGVDGGVTAVVTIPAEMVGRAEDELEGAPPIVVEPDAPRDADETSPIADLTTPDDLAGLAPLELPDPPTPTPEAPTPPANPFFVDDPTPAEPPPLEATVDDGGLAKLPTRRPKHTPDEPAPNGTVAHETAPAAPAETPPANEHDLFAAFGTPSNLPAPPSDPEADIFAPLDAGDGLPTRTPSDAEPAAAPAPEPPAAPAPLPSRDPAAVGAVPPQVTSAGLIRRTPKRVDVPEESKYSPGAGPAAAAGESTGAVAPTMNRSPEEVRQMLSRYRAGLRKGRAPEADTDQPNRRS